MSFGASKLLPNCWPSLKTKRCAPTTIDRRVSTVAASAFINNASSTTRVYRLLGAPVMAKELAPLTAAQDAADGYHIVYNTAVEGNDAAFNAWYDNHHVPDMLTIPGFVSGQRGAAATLPRGGDLEPPYIAIFRFRTDDMATLPQRCTGAMPHMTMEPVMAKAGGYTYLPHGKVLTNAR
jgi:hypothetical protein